MKPILMAIAFLASVPLAAAAQVTKEDLKKLTQAGISDEVILSYVRANGGLARLSAEDVIELKQAGASEKLLSGVLAPAPQPEPRVAPRESAPSTTYVVDSSPYYYTPASAYYASYYAPTYYWPYYGYGYGYYGGCYPRYYNNCYPRYYANNCYRGGYVTPHYGVSVGVGYSGGHYYGGSRGYVGVGVGVGGYRGGHR